MPHFGCTWGVENYMNQKSYQRSINDINDIPGKTVPDSRPQ